MILMILNQKKKNHSGLNSKICLKIRNSKINNTQQKSYNKIIITIILIVLLVNLAHSYKSVENYMYEQEPYSGILNEITKTFQRNEPLVENGMEMKQISNCALVPVLKPELLPTISIMIMMAGVVN